MIHTVEIRHKNVTCLREAKRVHEALILFRKLNENCDIKSLSINGCNKYMYLVVYIMTDTLTFIDQSISL